MMHVVGTPARKRCFAFVAAGVAALLLSGISVGPMEATSTASKLRELLSGEEKADAMLSNLGDVKDVDGLSHDTPVFWHIYKAGGSTMRDLLLSCLGKIVPGRGNFNDEELSVVKSWRPSVVNVDTTNVNGIERAARLGLAQSSLADVVISPMINKAVTEIFSPEYKGRLFALFRHPVDRLVSQYYDHQETNPWEISYDPKVKELPLGEYAKIYGDRMLKQLLDIQKGTVGEIHFERAKEIIATRCVVGLADKVEESVGRFVKYFGWESKGSDQCMADYFVATGDVINNSEYPSVEEGTEEWNAIAKAMPWDIKLYEYILSVFEEQGKQLGLDPATDSDKVTALS